MKWPGFFVTLILLVCLFSSARRPAWGASDGYYTVTETASAWDGTDGNTLKNPAADYDYAYGDDESVTFNLPWAITFYDQNYSTITADTNGNIWFAATNAANSFNLASTGRGPVIAAWNNDLSSSFLGGVFIQHKSNPERMVIEWQTETYTEQGMGAPNKFEVVIFPDGGIRYDYGSFNTQAGDDYGSGISRGDGSASLNLTTLFGYVFSLSGRSFMFTNTPPPTVSITSPSGYTNNNRPLLQYSVSGGVAVVKVDGLVVSKVSGNYLDLLLDGPHTVHVEATNAGITGSADSSFVVDTVAPVLTVSPVPGVSTTPGLTLTGNVEPGAGLNISSNTMATAGPISFGAGTWSCAVSNLAPGLNTFTLTAIDQATNSSTVSILVTYQKTMALALSTNSIAADYQGGVGLAISSINPAGSEVLIEQLVDANKNGVADADDYVIRSFKLTDGTVAANPNTQGDTDGVANGAIATTLNYFLTSDLYHSPGHYLFRATREADTAVAAFSVSQVSQSQTIAGMVTDGNNPMPGALLQLTDKWQRHAAYAIADASGNFVLNVKQAGIYHLLPVAYGYVATATPVSLAAGQNIENLSLILTAGTYHVTGNVKDYASDTGITGVWVQASDGTKTGTALTDSNGIYDLLLPSGQYSVSTFAGVTGPGTFSKGYVGYNKNPLPIMVNGNMATADISLSAGTIPLSGRALDITGNPVPGLAVMGKIKGTLDSREPVSCGISDAIGNYSLGLFNGTNWDVSLDNRDVQVVDYLVTVHSDLSTAAGPLGGNDLTAHQITGWIQGTVKDSTSKPLSGVEVKLRNADSSIIASVFTASDGTYRLGAFAGNWYISVLTENSGTPAVTEQAFTLVENQTILLDFVVAVTPPSLSITTSALPDAYFADNYNFTLAATGGMPPYSWSLISGQFPPKLELNASSGAITGLLADYLGQRTLIFQVTDANNTKATQVLDMNLYMFAAITTWSLPQGTVGAEYSKAVNVVGGKPPYTWSVSSGNLPAGLILNAANGVISGIPAASGSSNFTVQVIDSNGNMTSANYTNGVEAFKALSINVIDPLSITSNSLPSGNVNSVYGQALAASGGKSPYIWSISSGRLPAGLALTASTGLIAGIPATVGTSVFTVKVADSNNVTATKTHSIVINPALPDLFVTAVSGAVTGARGKTIAVSATVKNQGQGDAASSSMTFYLSKDAKITAADTLLGNKSVKALAAGTSQVVSGNFPIPASLAAGSFYVGAIADRTSLVSESDENNNGLVGGVVTVK